MRRWRKKRVFAAKCHPERDRELNTTGYLRRGLIPKTLPAKGYARGSEKGDKKENIRLLGRKKQRHLTGRLHQGGTTKRIRPSIPPCPQKALARVPPLKERMGHPESNAGWRKLGTVGKEPLSVFAGRVSGSGGREKRVVGRKESDRSAIPRQNMEKEVPPQLKTTASDEEK